MGLTILLWILVGGISCMILFSIYYAVIGEYLDDINTSLKCQECGLISRKGIIMSHNLSITEDSNLAYTKAKCPQCEEKAYFSTSDEPPIFAPAMSPKMAFQLRKSIKQQIYNNEASKQMQAYVKLQEKKTKQMEEQQNANL